MPARHLSISPALPAELVEGIAELETELEIRTEFPAEVVAAARAVRPRLPELDRTDLELVTIDPPGSRDLDQALLIEPDGDGYTVWYAIADVAAFVEPGGAIDTEARLRGQTLYAPQRRLPLHPPELSEGAASLLPDQDRPALLWRISLAADGTSTGAQVQRALVRSRRQLDYAGVQAALDSGTAGPGLELLRTVGRLREEQEVARGGVSLPIPEQEMVADGDGWQLAFRSPLPVEGWNAQISLLTGMAAATLMLDAGTGVLRTLPPADEKSLRRLRETARALSIDWPAAMPYPEFVRSLDPDQPRHAAMLQSCTRLFRGAGYLAFRDQRPEHAGHAAIAADYAHATAPLRRLVDRWVGEICVSVCAGVAIPEWVLAGLEELPDAMQDSERRAKAYERGIVDRFEALLLADRIGERFSGVVVSVDAPRKADPATEEDPVPSGTLVLSELAVEAKVSGPGLELGTEVAAVLTGADPRTGVTRFEL